jgi:class 3 adenylate cyclase
VPIAVAELEAAGLYDPAAPDAADRLVFLRWLVDHGATVPQMVRAARAGSLGDLVPELVRASEAGMTLAEVSARNGMPAERIQAMRFAVGLPPLAPDDPALSVEDARSLAFILRSEELFGRDAVRRFIQVLGASLARMAEAAISVALVNLEGPIRASGGSEVAIAEARLSAMHTVTPLAEAVAQFFKAHMIVAGRRLRRLQPEGSVDLARLTVGFVDLVGFTTLARQVEPRALAGIVERFEETAHDVVGLHDGRVVKFVGDEVMFVAQSAGSACEIALGLVDRFVAGTSVTPRGGIAAGDVLVRGGDYYGPIVNLAARMAEIAVPREVLVTEAVTTQAPGFRFAPAGRRMLKGFEEPVHLFTAERTP